MESSACTKDHSDTSVNELCASGTAKDESKVTKDKHVMLCAMCTTFPLGDTVTEDSTLNDMTTAITMYSGHTKCINLVEHCA